MDIISSHAYQGRNIYSHKPVVRMVVDLGEYWDTPTKDIEGFNGRIIKLLPGFAKHQCCLGYEGGFLERLSEGTYLAHVMEHAALEIQNMLGYSVKYGKARQTNVQNIYNVVFAYVNEAAGLEAGKLALDILNSLINGRDLDMAKRLEGIKKKAAQSGFGVSTSEIKKEAEARGIPVMRIGDGSLLQLGYGKNQKRIQATLTENATCIAVDTACNKSLTKHILHEYGIPVPEGKMVNSEQEAVEYCNEIGYPVVVKPNFGSKGRGVSINLRTPEEVIEAYRIAREFEETVLVEKYIKGNYYRILVVGDKVPAVSQRLSAHIVGDGKSTIKDLIEKENANPLRGNGHEKPLTRINIDKVVESYLKKQNLSLDYVPAHAEVVYLRENDNLSTGGIAIDMTDIMHPDNKQLAIQAAKLIGLDVAGIDMTAADITKPIAETGGTIIEVNAAPGIRMHHHPAKGQPRNAAKAIIDMLCPHDQCYSIPIVSITGTNGKTTTTRMIANIIRQKGYKVGMTTTSGVYIDGMLVKKGDNTGPASARTVLTDKNVEYAVLETARGGIVNKGLAYDLADVGIITNISEDHLGIDGIDTLEELAHVKSLVAEAVKKDGYAVLNADDTYCVGMSERVKSGIIYFSMQPDNETVMKHVSHNGTAVYLKDDCVMMNTGGNETLLMKVEDIPATMGGMLRHNIANALAATAGAIGIGMGVQDIRMGLASFKSDCTDNPGRFNIFDVSDIKVVLDYGHNIDGYKVVIDSLLRMKTNKLIGVIGVPGDRTDSSTFTVGKISGDYFDRIYIKEDKDKRGRIPGEVAEILKQGCLAGKISEERVTIELYEEKALELAIREASPGDMVVVFYEEYQPLVGVVEKMRAALKKEELIIA